MVTAAPPASATLLLDSRCELGESILWCERGKLLYWTDILAGRLWRLDPASGQRRCWQLPEALGCLALGEDGRLLLGLANGLHTADPEAHLDDEQLPLQLLATVEADDPHTRINDGRADRHGNFVFGTKSEHPDQRRAGRYYQWSARHGLRVLPLPPVAIPNAICFSPDGTRMHFCDSADGRILVASYDPHHARTGQPEVFAAAAAGIEPDGAVIDDDGHVWNAQWGGGRVVRFSADGAIERVVQLPVRHVTCCVLGNDALYVTSARIGLDAAGLAAEPLAGGVFMLPLAGVRARVDRVRLQ